MKTKIGFLSSCSTIDIFGMSDNANYSDDFEIVFQQQRGTLISLMQSPVPYTIESTRRIKNGKEKVSCSEWIRADLSKSLFNELKKGIDYLIIDIFFDVFFGVIIYDDTIITNNKWDSPFTIFYSNIENKEILTICDNHDKYFELWKENCNKFFEYMKQEFPKTKIILNKIRAAHMPSYLKTTEKLNFALAELEQYIIDNHDVKVINCLDYTIADENHPRGKYFINYVKNYYNFAYNQIRDIIIQDKINNIEELNKKINYMSKELELLHIENQQFIQKNEDLNKKYEKLKAEKMSSNSIDMSSLKSAKVGFSKVLIPKGYKLQTTRPNGALFYNGKTAMGIFELPRSGSGLNTYYENSIKQWNEEFGYTETTNFSLNNTTLKSVTVKNEQKRMKKTYFKKNGIEYHIFENGIGDKTAFDVLFNSVAFDFESSLMSKLKNIPQLSHTSFGYTTNNGKIRYHNWVGASFYPTLIDDFDGYCEREWFTRYLNNKFPNEDYKINFFGVFGTHHTLKYPMDGKKVLYSLENLTYRVSEMREEFDTYALDYVDLAMGYDLINDKKYLRFPFWARAHFSPEVNEEEIENKIDKWNSLSYEKTRDVINISSHDRWNLRKKIADDIEKVVEITYGGKWRNNTKELWTTYHNNKEKFMNIFKFNLCAENLDDHGYVTEKIFDSIKSDCIPLYIGGGDYLEPKILNHDAILRWFMDDTIDNTDALELFKNVYSDEKTYKEFKDQDILLDSSKKYIINLFSDLEKHFERLICE